MIKRAVMKLVKGLGCEDQITLHMKDFDKDQDEFIDTLAAYGCLVMAVVVIGCMVVITLAEIIR